jgi:large repetitive protein
MRIFLLFATMAGFAAAQTQPAALSVLPANGATNVPLNAHVIAALSYPWSFYPAPIKLTRAGVAVAGSNINPGTGSGQLAAPQGAFGWAEFDPAQPLAPNTVYNVEVDAPSAAPFLSSFTTGAAPDNTALQLTSIYPAQGQAAVSIVGQAVLHFNKPIDPFSFAHATFTVRDLAQGYTFNCGAQVQADGSTLVVGLPSSGSLGLWLARGYRFEYSFGAGADWLGNTIASTSGSVLFSTLATADTAGPALIGSAPADGGTGVATNSAIVLIFDKPLAQQLAFDTGISLDAAGLVKFTVDASQAGGQMLIVKPSLLLPPNTQVTLRIAGLIDQNGGVQAAPLTIGFITGAAPDTRPLQLSSLPLTPFPQNATIRTTFNRPVSPAMLALGGVSLSPLDAYTYSPVPFQLASDGRTLAVSPGGLLAAGSYQGQVLIPYDPISGKSQFGFTFTVSGDTDTTPPQVVAVTPPDGASGVPPASVVQVAFSEPVTTSSASAAPFQLLENGNPVAGTFTLNGSLGSFVPKALLDAPASFQISIASLADYAGNPLPPFTSSFSTAASSTTGALQVVSVTPAQGATADPSTTVSLTFNRSVNPVSLYQQSGQFGVRGAAGGVAGTYSVSGSTVTFTPAVPLAPGSYSMNAYGITDLTGAAMTSFGSAFQVSGAASTMPPTVVSISPADGGTVLYQDPYVMLTFSEPLSAPTVTAANFAAFGSKGLLPVTPTLQNGGMQVLLKFTADPSSLVTLYAGPGVTDNYGNPLTPFTSTVRVSPPPAQATAVKMRPSYVTSSNDLANLPPDFGLELFFSNPVDRASVEQGLIVYANGTPVRGSVVWTPDSMALTFLPATPYPYFAGILVAIVAPAHDAAGRSISFDTLSAALSLQIAKAPAAPSSAISIVATSFPPPITYLPLNFAIDLQFSQDVPAGFLKTGTATLTAGSSSTPPPVVVCYASQIGPRVIRFQAAAPLKPNWTYIFKFDSGTGVTYSNFVDTSAITLPPNPTLVGYGPVGSSIPLNAEIKLGASNPLSELSMPGAVTLQTGGSVVPVRYQWGPSDQGLTVIPEALLQPDADYNVTVSGLNDLAGQAIPAKTWNFHTSAAVDQQTPSIFAFQPTGSGVSPNASVSVTFSEPVAADWISGFNLRDGSGSQIAGTTQFSDDQRTLYFTPSGPLPAGATVSVNVPANFDDFAGNIAPGPSYGYQASTFQVAFAVPSAPVVTAATPDDGSTGVPLNVRIQARFDQPVLASSLAGVTLLENGTPVPAMVTLGKDGSTISVAPVHLPTPGSTYTFTVAGVQNSQGAEMGGQYQASFTMGAFVDQAVPSVLTSPASGQSEVPLNAVIHVRLNKPLNKLTVNPAAVALTWSSRGQVAAAVQLQDGGRTIAITPASLVPDTIYTVSLAGVTDLAGNLLAQYSGSNDPFTFSFTTASGAASTPPVLLAIDPADGAVLAPGFQIQALYSQPVDATLGAGSFTVSGPRGPVAGALSDNGTFLIFTPAQTLADGQYQLALRGLADVSGNPLPSVNTTFTVNSSVQNTAALRLTSSTPASGAVGVDVRSTVTLNFNRPVSAVSAAQLNAGFQNATIPGTFQTQGSTVVFTPSSPLPGAAVISITGTLRDAQYSYASAYVYLQFTTAANPDTTPPMLQFVYPPDGSSVPDRGVNLVLQFSKPVVIPQASLHVLSGSSEIGVVNWYAGADGRTYTASNCSFPPAATVTLASSPGIVDFAGNALQPFTVHYQVLSDDASRGPQLVSISPANGATNVPVDQAVEVRFSQPIDSVSLQSSLYITDAGAILPGTVVTDSTAQVFDYHPNVNYGPGDLVAVFVQDSVYTTSGVRVSPAAYSFFHTAPPAGALAEPTSFSVSPTAIDVRFDSAPSSTVCDGYLRVGQSRVAADCARMEGDQVRFTPSKPLNAGMRYSLVLDSRHEIVFSVDAADREQIPTLESVTREAAGSIAVRFRGPVNPLTAARGGLQLLGPDGQPVPFTLESALDDALLRLTPARLLPAVTVLIDGLESRAGARLPALKTVLHIP